MIQGNQLRNSKGWEIGGTHSKKLKRIYLYTHQLLRLIRSKHSLNNTIFAKKLNRDEHN